MRRDEHDDSTAATYRFDEMLQAELDGQGCLPYATVPKHHQLV